MDPGDPEEKTPCPTYNGQRCIEDPGEYWKEPGFFDL